MTRFPVIVKGSEFAKYVSDTNRGLAEYLIDHIDKKYAELFASKLHDNKLLVLLDGIDEINQHSLKHSVSERVNAFISQYPDIQIIVSSRVVGYQENCLNGYFTHLTVSKFEKEQIKTFIENWYQALSRNTSQTVDESQELYNSICKNQSVLKMASNPLLVTIIALIHYQGSTLPERRATLYDIATSTLLDNWVKQRNTGKKSIIDKDTLIEILAPVAFTMHENSTTGLICERNLKSKLTEEFKLISSFTNDFNIKKDVKDIIEFLREDAGFLFEKGVDENGESMFGFVHQTFQEYFTAIELKTKWKEGGLQESLKSLVLSSNWHEVIKLTASLFKHSEQSRVGRKDTTNFINQIFLIEDDLIETQRPLSLVVNILGEDTEVERQLFNNIFEAIINCGRQALKNKSNTNISYLLEILLNTQIYKNYVLQKMEALIYDENDNDEQLKYELISTLMSSSNQREVKESLDRVLNGNDIKLKEHMFDNRIVFPISPIVTTELFNSKIVEYVNSDYFNNKKEKRIPTQYTICYEDWRESPLDAAFASIETIKEFEAKLLSRYMAAIENLKDNELKQQLIDDYYDTVSFFSLETLQDYLSQLKQKFPSMSTSVIEKRINFYEEKEKLCLGDDCLVSHQGIRIYPCIDSKDSFAFIKGSVITKLKYPFKKSEIVFEDIADSDSFLEYLNFFLLSYTDPTKDLTIDSKETILLFIKFDDIYDWKRQEQLSPIRAKAFDFLFCDDNLIEKNISNWLIDMYIKHPMISRAIPQNEIHNVDVLIKKIKKSEMPKHEKLCLLLMLGDEHEKENLIKESIIEYQTRTSAAEKDRLHKILAKVM
ncbi:hypothetical protein KQ246_05890 [Pseudoalteromonas shioyasakiensis]|nr:hypothetical protein KQ246_05890 [Pseudoalteromonas shioyasakiensis]